MFRQLWLLLAALVTGVALVAYPAPVPGTDDAKRGIADPLTLVGTPPGPTGYRPVPAAGPPPTAVPDPRTAATPAPPPPTAFPAVAPGQPYVYVVEYGRTIRVLDPRAGKLVAELPVGWGAQAVFSPDGGHLYVAHTRPGRLHRPERRRRGERTSPKRGPADCRSSTSSSCRAGAGSRRFPTCT